MQTSTFRGVCKRRLSGVYAYVNFQGRVCKRQLSGWRFGAAIEMARMSYIASAGLENRAWSPRQDEPWHTRRGYETFP